jgi:hypothetical protein
MMGAVVKVWSGFIQSFCYACADDILDSSILRACRETYDRAKMRKNMIVIIYTNKCTIISLLNIHHAYMFRPNWSSSGHLQNTKVLKCV